MEGAPLTSSPEPLHPEQPHVRDAMAAVQKKMGKRYLCIWKMDWKLKKVVSAEKLPTGQTAGVLQGWLIFIFTNINI